MAERTFSRWIIDLMYTVFPPKKDKDLDPIWEMGCKLYIQMTKMCLNSDTSSHFYIHQLLVWPIIKYLKQRSSKDRVSNDIKRRERMVRTVICSFLDTISSNKEREKWNPSFGRDNPFMKFWRNITQILFHIEELILSFEYIRLAFSDDSSTPLKTSKRKKMISEEFSSSILERKTDQSIFENTKNYLFLSSVSNTWQDSRLLNMIFEIIEPIWTIKSKRRTSKAHKSSHTMYFKK